MRTSEPSEEESRKAAEHCKNLMTGSSLVHTDPGLFIPPPEVEEDYFEGDENARAEYEQESVDYAFKSSPSDGGGKIFSPQVNRTPKSKTTSQRAFCPRKTLLDFFILFLRKGGRTKKAPPRSPLKEMKCNSV
jgi:hypothetical protein